jgi:hypothetical protein
LNRLTASAAVVAVGLFSVLGGTAVANGGSGSARFCSATASNVIGGDILISVEMSEIVPSQKGYATCGYARKVVGKVTAAELTEPRVIAGFDCTTTVLRLKDPIRRYDCRFRGADTATEINIRFRVRYVAKSR